MYCVIVLCCCVTCVTVKTLRCTVQLLRFVEKCMNVNLGLPGGDGDSDSDSWNECDGDRDGIVGMG